MSRSASVKSSHCSVGVLCVLWNHTNEAVFFSWHSSARLRMDWHSPDLSASSLWNATVKSQSQQLYLDGQRTAPRRQVALSQLQWLLKDYSCKLEMADEAIVIMDQNILSVSKYMFWV